MVVYLSEYIYPEAAKKLREHATVVDNFDHIEEIDAHYSAEHPGYG